MSLAQSQVIKLVKDKGRSATLNLKSAGSYDTATSSYTPGTPVSHTVDIYSASYKLDEVNGKSILIGDQQALIPVLDSSGNTIDTPKINDTILVDSVTFIIKSVQTIYEGSTKALYLCQARR
jgi:hypothetical protein